MSEPSFVKRNAFLIAAAVLPVVVVVLFAIAVAVPRWLVDDPTHDVLFVIESYERQRALRFEVDGGRVFARVVEPSDAGTAQGQRLFRYDVETDTTLELTVPIAADKTRFVVPELTATVVHPANPGPDGYEFFVGRYGGSSLVQELFGMRSRRHRAGLARDSRMIPIDSPAGSTYRYGTVRFVAFVVEP
ncbi:MAG: hypothetical protein AAGE01_19060 [Pseudomonadota bacterium]